MKKLFKKIKVSHLIILVFLLSFNAYAWFIYATEVSTGLSVHVKSWKILFKAGDEAIVDYIDIDIDSVYPGMEDFVNELEAYNLSESNATVSYEILSARILDTTYKSVEGYRADNEEVPANALTSSELSDKLKNDFPFKIDISVTNEEIDAEVGSTKYIIRVYWPFESGNDSLDTFWGNRAYDYNKRFPDNPSMSLKIKVKATQNV